MKKRNRIGSFLTDIIIPFITVFLISLISVSVFVAVKKVAGGNDTIVFFVMLSTVLAMSVLFLVGNKLRKKISTEIPVKEILDATEKIAAGDFSVRINTTHPYEKYNDYDIIKENLNAMAAELEKSEIFKTDFISNVSHELKTPLAIIQNYIFLLQGELDKETKKKYIQTVIAATKRLNNLITNILKLNKLEHQELNLEYEKICLDDMLSEAVLSFEELIDQKQLQIECDFEQVEIVSARNYLEIVWNNLLSNAIKFTDNGGKIKVTLKEEFGNAVVEVTDTGCGISIETGARIFDKFYQGDTSHSSEGNGLGLALVKKVIDLIGGEISVISEPNVGSTFKVVLKDSEQ